MIEISYQEHKHDVGNGIELNPDGTIHRDCRHSAYWCCKICGEWLKVDKGNKKGN